MSKKQEMLRWFYQELPGLISKGVLDLDTAERLKSHYGPVSEFDRKNLALSIVTIAGSICIGLGIILLFAYNWDSFSRLQKVGISSLPLLTSFFLIWKVGFQSEPSTAARESIACFNVFSLGAAIAIISQAYHLPADIQKFMLCWMVLSIPSIYFLKSSTACLLYLMGLTFWASDAQNSGGHALLFWPLVAFTAPFLAQHYLKMKKTFSLGTFWLMLAVCICFTVSLGVSLEKTLPGLWIMIYSAFFSLLFVVGSYLVGEDNQSHYPFRRYGLVALVILSYMLTFSGWWEKTGWDYYRVGGRYHEWVGILDYIILALMLSTSSILLWRFTKQRGVSEAVYGYLPIITTLFFLLHQLGFPEVYIGLVFNFYLLFVGFVAIRKGIKEMRLIWLNAGLVIVGVLIATRFLDQTFGILGRAFVFILLGIVLLLANYLMKRKMLQVHFE